MSVDCAVKCLCVCSQAQSPKSKVHEAKIQVKAFSVCTPSLPFLEHFPNTRWFYCHNIPENWRSNILILNEDRVLVKVRRVIAEKSPTALTNSSKPLLSTKTIFSTSYLMG